MRYSPNCNGPSRINSCPNPMSSTLRSQYLKHKYIAPRFAGQAKRACASPVSDGRSGLSWLRDRGYAIYASKRASNVCNIFLAYISALLAAICSHCSRPTSTLGSGPPACRTRLSPLGWVYTMPRSYSTKFVDSTVICVQ
jgi:hypothetical protein